jgi:hypothetical protein
LPYSRSDFECVADALGLKLVDGDNRRGPNPFTGEGIDRFCLFFPNGNGSERNGGLKYSRLEVAELAKQRGAPLSLPSPSPTDKPQKPQGTKTFDTRSLEERGLSVEACSFFQISGPLGVNEGWGEYRQFPTFHPDGTQGRSRHKFRDPSRQPTEDKNGKPRKPCKTLWDPKTKPRGIPPAYGLNYIQADEVVYIVNSELAVWHYWQKGLRAICPLGEGRSENSFRAIAQVVKDKGAAQIVVLLDADATGQSSVLKVVDAAQAVDIPVVVKDWPEGVKNGFDASDFWEQCEAEGRELTAALSGLPERRIELAVESFPVASRDTSSYQPPFISAHKLMDMDIPLTRWAVPGLISEGLTILAGAPKLGKSWFSLNLCTSVSNGGIALGRFNVEAGDVLYLALEDTPRRMQERLRLVLQDSSPPDNLDFLLECPPFDKGGGEAIESWLKSHPHARLIVIDTFKKVRQMRVSRNDFYGEDYDQAGQFKALADKYGVAIVLVHHTTKLGSDDPLKSVSGSMGITGAADTILVLTRDRQSDTATLFVTGRDVEESRLAFRWTKATCSWTCEGDIEIDGAELSEKAQSTLAVLQEKFPNGATSTEWEKECTERSISRATFHRAVVELVKHQKINDPKGKRGAKYQLQGLSKVSETYRDLAETHFVDAQSNWSQGLISIEDETLRLTSNLGYDDVEEF